jgi:hypothetical protein
MNSFQIAGGNLNDAKLNDVKLNNDIIRLLFKKYIHPGDLLSFAKSCKRFYNAASMDEIYLKYIRYVAKKYNPENKRNYDEHTICELCNVLLKKKNFDTHMKKVSHNPNITMRQKDVKLQCELCKLYLPSGNHERYCIAKKVECRYHQRLRSSVYNINSLYLCLCSGEMYRLQEQRHNNYSRDCRFMCCDCNEGMDLSISELDDHSEKYHKPILCKIMSNVTETINHHSDAIINMGFFIGICIIVYNNLT